jgi:hypothetical protein
MIIQRNTSDFGKQYEKAFVSRAAEASLAASAALSVDLDSGTEFWIQFRYESASRIVSLLSQVAWTDGARAQKYHRVKTSDSYPACVRSNEY